MARASACAYYQRHFPLVDTYGMSSEDRSGLIEAVFVGVGAFAGLALAIVLAPDPWVVWLILAAGTTAGMIAHLAWQRRPLGRKVRPERLKGIATAIRTYRAGSDHYGDRRKWAATTALKRIAADGTDPVNREQIATFARTELENEVRRQPDPRGIYPSTARGVVDLLAITNPDWQDQFLESLLGTPDDRVVRERLADMRRIPILGADRQYVLDALMKFEERGLKIKPHLDRELIAARALLEADRWRYVDDDPPELGKKIAPDPLAELFAVLAGETDELRDWEGIGFYRAEPEPLRSIRAEASQNANFAEDYSPSIFENAAEIWTVNEGRALEQALDAIVALSGDAITLVAENEPHSGEVKIAANGTVLTCWIGGGKRPDLTPLYDILNRAALEQGYQYVFPSPGSNSDSELIACIAVNKLDAFNAFTKPLNSWESHS